MPPMAQVIELPMPFCSNSDANDKCSYENADKRTFGA